MNEEIKDKMQYVVNSSNVIATPHIAGYTFEALYKMSKALLVKAIGRL
jgi:lactate dehydrogenase-like 2-hydroxyacid dehydrogenase